MEIEFLNLKKAYQELKTELDQAWQDINNDAIYILGRRLEQFEQEFATYLGVRNVIGVANGLDALTLSIKALDIKSGDEVIVPAHTYIASWLAVSEAGATPVPVEVNPATFLIEPKNIIAAITTKTKAIMPVHLYGKVCDMQSILAIAKEYNLKVIEDAAQAHGAIDSNNRKAGAFGDTAGFSFYPGKNLGCFGDGGCIATNDDQIAEKLRLLRNYGSKVRYEHLEKGVNSRLDEIQAKVLSIKLKHLDEWNTRRRNIARLYSEELKNVSGIILPKYDDGDVWHMFCIITKKRDELKDYLTQNKIGSSIHYPKPVHMQNAYAKNYHKGAFPITERISDEILSLPIGPHLGLHEAQQCANVINRFFS